MKLIETKTLSVDAASIEFTAIPQTPFSDLVLLVSARSVGDGDAGGSWYAIRFNGGTIATSARYVQGNGSGPSSLTLAGFGGVASTAAGTANTFGNDSIYIPNYTSSTAKAYSTDTVSERNATAAYQTLIAGLWNSTAAITTITLVPSVGNFVSGTSVSLYGITRGTGGATVS